MKITGNHLTDPKLTIDPESLEYTNFIYFPHGWEQDKLYIFGWSDSEDESVDEPMYAAVARILDEGQYFAGEVIPNLHPNASCEGSIYIWSGHYFYLTTGPGVFARKEACEAIAKEVGAEFIIEEVK